MKESILNLGCGNSKEGTDFVDLYPSRSEVKKCDIDNEKLPFRDRTFDKVIFSNVLEHVKNKGFVLSEIKRVLKKNGILHLKTDNANYWGYSVGKTHLGGYEKLHPGDKHFSLFTDHHIKSLINSTKNFEITELKFTDSSTKDKNLKNIAKGIINLILKHTPLWRMAYPHIEVKAEKLDI